MNKLVIYIHGQGGTAAEADHYMPLFPGDHVIGFDYHAATPWEAKDEFTAYFDEVGAKYDSVIVIANSIGAYFAMNAQHHRHIEKAYFISPVVDMEQLLTDMMRWAAVTEEDLKKQKQIKTDFGETLSWEYLCYTRNNPVKWKVPTCILYGEKDHLTAFETMSSFAAKNGATLDVMPGGEHWFHTDEQMAYLDNWIKNRHCTPGDEQNNI